MTTTFASPFTLDLASDDEWMPWPGGRPPLVPRSSSISSYGVTVIGRGNKLVEDEDSEPEEAFSGKPTRNGRSPSTQTGEVTPTLPSFIPRSFDSDRLHRPVPTRKSPSFLSVPKKVSTTSAMMASPAPLSRPPSRPHVLTGQGSFIQSPSASPVLSSGSSPGSPLMTRGSLNGYRTPNISRPGTPGSRRRSSQQRVSLVAGRLALIPNEPVVNPEVPQRLVRSGSTRSFLSVASSAGPPTPGEEQDFSTGKSLSEYVIECEIGRGAYGLVKRAREMDEDGKRGPPLIIKQIIKLRILADCWKRHPKHGTIPIEIYVMDAISSTTYVLPPRRPWDPMRNASEEEKAKATASWVEGQVVHGHPNICKMLDFFEDDQYYYMIMPSSAPEPVPNEPKPPSDLFDLVEAHPHGLPPTMIRSYLGQIADALSFLHSKGIVHRDIKDENVVLGPNGTAILIDFGSSGMVRKAGWDTFSGTLDYAGPEILRGERYFGKEQDVWAFGVVAYVLLVGECPFTTAAEAQDGLESPFSNARIALDERCAGEPDVEEADGGGALSDAGALVRACLQIELTQRPTFDEILRCKFLMGHGGWVERP